MIQRRLTDGYILKFKDSVIVNIVNCRNVEIKGGDVKECETV